jgi:hypothetical protein
MLLMITYQIISGNSANLYWDLISTSMTLAAVSGDSIILLVYDSRWKSSVRDIFSEIKKIASFYNS